jgi:uncharacterized protein YlxW (UPF0749 family)
MTETEQGTATALPHEPAVEPAVEPLTVEPAAADTEHIDNYDEPSDASIVKTEQEIITDQQIDELLEQVEQIRQSSPVKVKEVKEVTPDDASTLSDLGHDSLETLAKADGATSVEGESEGTPKSNIPKSVSQALFGGGLKVTKVRDQRPELKFIGLKKENIASDKKVKALQLKLVEINQKISKLNREISYLNNLIDTAAISSDLTELKKLRFAIQRLEEFLDEKQKEKYEIGMVLTRAMRRRIDSGESGEFWVN